MQDPLDRPQSSTDAAIVERSQGKAERIVLGKSPLGSMIRIGVAALLFIVIFGTIFYFAQH